MSVLHWILGAICDRFDGERKLDRNVALIKVLFGGPFHYNLLLAETVPKPCQGVAIQFAPLLVLIVLPSRIAEHVRSMNQTAGPDGQKASAPMFPPRIALWFQVSFSYGGWQVVLELQKNGKGY